MDDLIKQDVERINNLIQTIPNVYVFFTQWDNVIENHLITLSQIVPIIEKYYDTDNWEDFRKLLLRNAGKLVEDGIYISKTYQESKNIALLNTYANQFKIEVDLTYAPGHITESINSSNIIDALTYLSDHKAASVRLELTEDIIKNKNNIYSDLSSDDKLEVIRLLSTFYTSNGFNRWKIKQYDEGLHYPYDMNSEFQNFLNSGGEYTLFNRAFTNISNNSDYPSRQEALNIIQHYDYSKTNSTQNKNLLDYLSSQQEYDLWLNTARQAHDASKNELGEKKISFSLSTNLFQYIIKEGTYEDFKMIQDNIQPEWYRIDFNKPYNNQNHDVRESLLFELALRGKRLEFDEFLMHYEYVDQNLSEYRGITRFGKSIEVLLKDEVELLSHVLKEYKEYAMLDSLKTFKEKFVPTVEPVIENEPNINTANNKSFFKTILSFAGILKKEENINMVESNSVDAPISSTEKTHEEFAHELNQYSKTIQEKFAFLSRKIKITSSIETSIKKEICENIETISTNSLMIEKILQKEYNTRHVEEYVRYKSLTGKNFVQAVEQYLTFNTELKNDLQSNGATIEEYLNQFRAQVQYIQSGLESIKTSLKYDREEDLMLRMQTDTQMLKMKQNG